MITSREMDRIFAADYDRRRRRQRPRKPAAVSKLLQASEGRSATDGAGILEPLGRLRPWRS